MRIRSIAPLLAASVLIPAPAQSAPGDTAGVSAAVNGKVSRVLYSASDAERRKGIGKNLSTGESIFLGDAIATGPRGRLQILLLDETSFTIGPNARMAIDEFVYDPKTSRGKVSARIIKGAFRFVSGKIAAKNPRDVTIRTQKAVIGIRGTTVYGFVGAEEELIGLGGPGQQARNTRQGSIVVFSGKTQSLIHQANFGVIVKELGEITRPMRFKSQAIMILGELRPKSGPSDPPSTRTTIITEANVVDQSGVKDDIAATQSSNQLNKSETEKTTDDETTQAVQTATAVQERIAKFGDLLAVAAGEISGTTTFDLNPVSGSGTATNRTTWTINFSSRTITLDTTTTNLTTPAIGGPHSGNLTRSGSYQGADPNSAVILSGKNNTPGVDTERTTTFYNTSDGVARKYTTTLTMDDRNGNILRGSGTATMK